MTSNEIRRRFLEFYKARGHVIIPSASLVPENDPTTLFTGSGMQPLVPYLLGQPHPEGKRVANAQKSFRAEDIDEVGDNRHTTFFEMLGNWSFGDYFKKEQLAWFFEFLIDKEKGAGLDPKNLYVTVFAGDAMTGIPRDEESMEIWKTLFAQKGTGANYVELGSEKEGSEKGMQDGRIFSYGVKKNWWSRAGVPLNMPAGEPGGPDSEVFYDFGTEHDPKFGTFCHPNCDCGRFLEIGNSVFMEYKKSADGSFEKLVQRNVDFGGGLERITAAANNDPDIFHIDVFSKMKKSIDNVLGLDNRDKVYSTRFERIVLDHVRSAVFLMGDGVVPDKNGRDYVLRKLIRRAHMAFGHVNKIVRLENINLLPIAEATIQSYGDIYPELKERQQVVLSLLKDEQEKFTKTKLNAENKAREIFHQWGNQLGVLEKICPRTDFKINAPSDSGEFAFIMESTYGLPYEVFEDLAAFWGFIGINKGGYLEAVKKHRDLSRAASAGVFKGGLADHSERTTRLHTAHHLLLKALQTVLGPQVKQRGSNITSERLRMDFLYDAKMTDEQKKEVERIVNEKIAEDLPVIRTELPRDEAEKLGAEHEFGQKYPDRVSVYSIGPKSAMPEDPQFEKAYSIEFCGGPHITHTGAIGKIKIVKEEAVAAGVRRIRATIEA